MYIVFQVANEGWKSAWLSRDLRELWFAFRGRYFPESASDFAALLKL